MGGRDAPDKFIVKGKRLDGRKLDELRPVTVKVGVVPTADGSAEVSFGETTAVATVHGPRRVLPKHTERSHRAVLKCMYGMAPYSTTDRCRPGPNRRSKEISKIMVEALSPAVYLEKYPQTEIFVFTQIQNANAGTRTAAISAAGVALADAGIEMRDLVVSNAAGKIDGKVVLDLFQEEDNYGEGDVPIAVLPNTEEITLLQLDGNLTPKEVKESIDISIKAAKEIYKAQRTALIEKYKGDQNESG